MEHSFSKWRLVVSDNTLCDTYFSRTVAPRVIQDKIINYFHMVTHDIPTQ